MCVHIHTSKEIWSLGLHDFIPLIFIFAQSVLIWGNFPNRQLALAKLENDLSVHLPYLNFVKTVRLGFGGL